MGRIDYGAWGWRDPETGEGHSHTFDEDGCCDECGYAIPESGGESVRIDGDG